MRRARVPKTIYHNDSSQGNLFKPLPKKIAAVRVNPDIRKYVEKTLLLDEKEHWLSCPEIPTAQEIMGQTSAIDVEDNAIDLPTNNIDAPWKSSAAYLCTHYELLREDSVSLLRDVVALVRNEPKMLDTNDVCIYEKTFITGLTASPKGIATKVSFSIARAGKKIVWEYSSRLISGSMVALSPAEDCFQTQCLVAIVAARPVDQVKEQPHQIDLFFADTENAPFDPQQEWIMVQSRSGYFESTRHIMKTLQVMNKESFPLVEHICSLKSVIEPPAYLSENPRVKLFNNEYIDVLSDWPLEPQNNLDNSQWEALHQILTKRLAIIQGPPGTGKTHVSVSALKLFLSNWRKNDPPIIVAAHTNHALDQLLNHVSAFVPDYVRLGGRSLDENVKKRTLFEVSRSKPGPRLLGSRLPYIRQQFERISEQMAVLLSPFSNTNSHGPLSAEFFHQHGALTDKQYELLCEGAQQWTGPNTEAMGIWLGDEFFEHRLDYVENDYMKEEDETDLEYEQLKELEQESDYLDDEIETLKGPFLPLREICIGTSDTANPSDIGKGNIEDLWQIPPGKRGTFYNKLRRSVKSTLLSPFRYLVRQYNKLAMSRQIGKWELDYTILKDAKLIGMTTTGLSKYRALLSALKPKIIMIEEAAETIEAPVAAACVESLEHFILVGDHKQLQGNCSVKELEDHPFFLNVSMFERLVKNGVDFRTLTLQRRMVPEIRRLLTPIYDNIQDHDTVKSLAPVPAMGDLRAFFFSHTWKENADSMFSKYNHNEAIMVATFFLHLVLAGLSSDQITVLTFYNGQRKKILGFLKGNPHLQGRNLKVFTVDSYQGEENDVVLLSLVRSSDQNGIGFVKIENRVCVALSRARRGLYMFGNAEHLASESPLWMKVIEIMSNDDETTSIARYIPIKCDKHGKKEFVEMPEELGERTGGCDALCTEILNCGHRCNLRCHNFEHADIRCQSTCGRQLRCGHTCGNVCAEEICLCSTCGYSTTHPKIHAPKQVTPTVQTKQPLAKNHTRPSITYAEKARVAAFHHFANGGVKEHDRRVAECSRIESAQETLARLDAEAEAALFADDEEEKNGTIVSPENSVGQILSDVEDSAPTRKRWVDMYVLPEKSLKNVPVPSKEMSLLDLSD